MSLLRSASESLLSDRYRGWKVAFCLALTALICANFVEGPGLAGSSYSKLARGLIPREEIEFDRPVGPELVLVKEIRPDGLRADSFNEPVELLFPEGAAGEAARAEAARFKPGDYVNAVSLYLDGNRFRIVTIGRNDLRRWKLAISAAGALGLAALFPYFFRWAGGAFRPRGTDGAA